MSDLDTKWTFSQDFYHQFQATRSDLASRIDAAKSSPLPSAPVLSVVQELTIGLAGLAKSLTDATGSLPSYDQRQCELQLKTLEKSLDDLRTSVTPKHKFAFKRKVAAQPSKPGTDRSASIQTPDTKTSSTAPAFTISSHSHRYLKTDTLFTPENSTFQSEVSISDIEDCIVNLLPSKQLTVEISALHIQRLSSTVLLIPPIKGSVILHELSNCVVISACHQFRMHRSTSVDVYLAGASNPTIEHCTRIRFGTYPEAMQLSPDHQKNVQLSIQDFSHIRSSPSPNWSSLSGGEADKIWTQVATGDEEYLMNSLKEFLPV
ncbi:hypothetical protein SERLA73DRAFT_179112 [Serpula lacrymans var. lacrymans S7.3]|uniref:C-CAP/cofactor C-like domain-containing protein n=2 Tax=Serpula lacrymans var. lacrymans TaxID=341189 RepID=F8PTR7_SERL3|nr:uncharacterized protein SERLADRAFT_464085 [Serpula lacrymans var. lacrymans S7.9]EGO01062.1 hypothetical protein SERLA73DRAFT_179112 [Serpula lacrymans var. lacrymans S7.3]EGO26719.1 hypothetical protein SERLADRAFT_464085 [Serpula lacrymans var. lacrymans S7.9]